MRIAALLLALAALAGCAQYDAERQANLAAAAQAQTASDDANCQIVRSTARLAGL